MATKDALWASGYDETVEVNQRALIDKVLARYSGEFTVFRELLQNSDDARSEAVEIHFDTTIPEDGAEETTTAAASALEAANGELKDLKTIMVKRWTFKNNGILFRDEDWSRLKKIAEGNPDEEKIGAFGVGFYSLFSITDDPFVTSGDKWMGFYWKDKKDQLFARRGDLPEGKHTEWTSFEMPLREPAAMPAPFDFIRFLCSSITFMTTLRKISVFLDDKCLAKLEKTVGASQNLAIPRGLNCRSPLSTMTVTGVRSTALHIRADVMKWVYSSGSERKRPLLSIPKIVKPTAVQGFFSSIFGSITASSTPSTPNPRVNTPLPPTTPAESDLLQINSTSISLSVFSADVSVKLNKKMTAELVRSTKKNPPSIMRYDLIYTGQADYEASIEEDKKYPSSTGSIFQGLRADIDGLGTSRVFIGHATAQTTGIGGHMAARFIPTVERESIDFMDRNVAVWNKELLSVGAVLARAAYEFELAEIKADWAKHQTVLAPPPAELQEAYTKRALHALRFFTFHQSTPSPDVSQLLEEGFFASLAAFPIISSKGVRPSTEVRLQDASLAGFLKDLPILPDLITTGSPQMVTALQNRRLLKPTVFEDILAELKSRPLKAGEMVACMQWWINTVKSAQGYQDQPDKLLPFQKQLISAAVLGFNPGTRPEDEKVVPLSSIRTFVGAKTILPVDGPLPDHVLPLLISQELNSEALRQAFPWTELTVEEWLSHLCSLTGQKGQEEFDITISPQWAERVLSVLARAWPALAAATKGKVFTLLSTKACIPTNNGMKIPADSYFPNVNMFPDLPIVTLPSGNTVRGGMERFLQSIGIRKHVELQVVFTRMVKTNQWTIPDLIKYLVSVRSTLTHQEMETLKATKAFSKENDQAKDAQGQPPRYCANQLYEPSDTFRKLGLPVLDWGQKVRWRSNSEEAKFLQAIGLRTFPNLATLISLCASDDVETRTTALRYLLDNMEIKYKDYSAENFASIPYLPAIKQGKDILGTPKEVFATRHWGELGFAVIHPLYQADTVKLQVRDHPPAIELVKLLQNNPPRTDADATKIFASISTRITDFNQTQLNALSQTPFVPVKVEKKQGEFPEVTLRIPSTCYLRSNNDAIHSKFFTFVDFGNAANTFLMACGAKQEPSLEEVVKILLDDPRKFYETCGGPEQYLSELRTIAVNTRVLSTFMTMRMKRSPILLAMQRKPKKLSNKPDMDDDEWDITYDLMKAENIVVVDDTAAYQIFGDLLSTAPQEDVIEGFYLSLGSRKLSGLVKEEHHVSSEMPTLKRANEIRNLVLERLPLFLYEHTHSKTRVSLTWLSSPNNFKVRAFGTLAISKTLSFGNLRQTQRTDASAVAKRVGSGGPIELWIAGNTQVDLYEVALSMNKLIFDSPKTNDALLLMTILSTDLKSLQRRGYNVSRILKQQQHAREAQLPPAPPPPVPPRPEAPVAAAAGSSEKSSPPPLPGALPPPPPLPPKPESAVSPQEPGAQTGSAFNKPTPFLPQMPTGMANTLHNLRQRFDKATGNAVSPSQPSGSSSAPPPPPRPASSSDTQKGTTTTPQNVIASNINMAIQGCRPESQNLLRNREHMEQIKESLNESYCDVSGHNQNMQSLGQIGNIKIYISQDVPPAVSKTFIQSNHDALARFIHVLLPLASIYGLPQQSLHIFYDTHGGLIAFNRNGSLFMNFRYYESWHDEQVQSGNLTSAYISWYFTLAHEIAHNLVQPHNSEHEFYFSAICEKHLIGLASLVSS